MSKKTLAAILAKELGVKQKAAEKALTMVFGNILGAALVLPEVRIAGFGTFKLKKRAARQGRNPATGAPMDIPAKETITFKLVKSFQTSIDATSDDVK